MNLPSVPNFVWFLVVVILVLVLLLLLGFRVHITGS